MYTEIKYLYLKQHSVTAGLTEAQLLEMASLVKVKNIKKGESVYMEDGFDSRIYLLSKGRIKI
jgi:CRP-like cAMP-binding protein